MLFLLSVLLWKAVPEGDGLQVTARGSDRPGVQEPYWQLGDASRSACTCLIFFFFVSLWVVGFCYFGVYVPILYFCPYYNSLPRNTSALRSFHITSVEQAASPAGINLCTCRDPPEPGAWSCVGLVTSKSSWMFIHPVLAAKSTHVCVCQ